MQTTGSLGVQKSLQDSSEGNKAVVVREKTVRELLGEILLELRKQNLLLSEGLNVKGIDHAPAA